MKQSVVITSGLLLFLGAVGANTTKQEQILQCNGEKNQCSSGPQRSDQKQTTKLKIPVSGTPGRKRSVQELFYESSPGVFRRFLAPRGTPPAKSPLSVTEVVSMINNGQAFPPALQGPAAAFARDEGLTMPTNLKPTPPELADHPCTLALDKLQKGRVAPEIKAAAAAKWVKAGTPAPGGKVKARDADAESGVEYVFARAEVPGYSGSIWTREAMLVDDEDLELFAREAGLFDDDSDIYTRDPEPFYEESYFEYDF